MSAAQANEAALPLVRSPPFPVHRRSRRLGLQTARDSRTHQREVRGSNPLCPRWFPGPQKLSQFRSVSEAQRGLRTEFRPFSRVLRLKSPAGLSPQNSVSQCLEAFALIFVPLSATWPSFTSPAYSHSLRTCANSPASAFK